jgi:hypothetical protein
MITILVEYIIALHSSLNTTTFFSLSSLTCPSTTDKMLGLAMCRLVELKDIEMNEISKGSLITGMTRTGRILSKWRKRYEDEGTPAAD